MTLSHPLSDELAELIARRFHLLAEPTRIKLLDRLRVGEASVHELAAQVGTTPQNVSKHLRALADAGVLERRRRGNFAYYHVVDDGIWELCHLVCDSAERRLEELHAVLGARPLVVVPAERRDPVQPGLRVLEGRDGEDRPGDDAAREQAAPRP